MSKHTTGETGRPCSERCVSRKRDEQLSISAHAPAVIAAVRASEGAADECRSDERNGCRQEQRRTC
jgi:hypothetical protein